MFGLFRRAPRIVQPNPADPNSTVLLEALVFHLHAHGRSTMTPSVMRAFWLATGWHQRTAGHRPTNEPFEVWRNGPIPPRLYRTVQHHEEQPVPPNPKRTIIPHLEHLAVRTVATIVGQSDHTWRQRIQASDGIPTRLLGLHGLFVRIQDAHIRAEFARMGQHGWDMLSEPQKTGHLRLVVSNT